MISYECWFSNQQCQDGRPLSHQSSLLNYCNSLLYDTFKSNISKLQRVQVSICVRRSAFLYAGQHSSTLKFLSLFQADQHSSTLKFVSLFQTDQHSSTLKFLSLFQTDQHSSTLKLLSLFQADQHSSTLKYFYRNIEIWEQIEWRLVSP